MTGCHSCVALQGLLCLGVSGHGSSGQTCSSRPIPRPHLALYLAQPARHQDPHICVSKGLFNLHGPSRQGAICRVHVFKRSCSHFSQVCHAEGTRARTDTKEGKTQANHGFCRGLSILLAEIGSGCAHRFHQSHVTDDLVSSLCWFGCCCCFCCCCAVLFCCWWLAAASCCWFAGAGWLLLLVSYCWLAAAGLVLPAVWLLLVCCCRLAAAVWLVGCCWLPSAAVGLLVLFCCWLAACCCLLLLAAAAAAACATKPTHLLLAVVAQTLSLWQCCKLGLESMVLN